jgi:hypothetical protein
MSPIDHEDEPEPTEEELRAAAELARALDAKSDPPPGSDAAFARALRATQKREPELELAARDRLVQRAMSRGASQARSAGRRRWLAVAAAALIAVAIPVGLAWQTQETDRSSADVRVTAAFGGPTDTIFGGPFDDAQRSSERMDRIANVRAHDYFAAIAAAGQP